MLLTLSQPTKVDFPGGRSIHDFAPRLPLPQPRLSPQPKVDIPVSSLRASVSVTDENNKMSTPHRGLPPPSAMGLPDPTRAQPPSLGQPLGAMPTPPNQWQGQEESMRNWLVAKAEEDKRKQEEEKTRQESYRLEQRRIEQSMLRESLSAGVPPTMVPMIYAGLGGSSPANLSLDWLQQYAGQLQTAQQQVQQQSPPQLRRESRVINQAPPSSYPQTIQQQVMPTQLPVEQPPPNQPLQTTFSAYQPVQQQRTATGSAPRSAAHASLPRLTTNEMYVHQPPPHNPGSAHPLQQGQGIQQEPPASSPSIYFHHWVPPNEANKNQQPPTPASKGEPSSAHPGSHLPEGGEHKESPRKRKAQGGHQPVPPPASAGPHYTSPSFSTMSSTSRKAGHARTRSSGSTRGLDSRPQSRRGPEPMRSQALPFERIEDQGRREMSIERRSGAPPVVESRAFAEPARREER
ncbi:hypothetical protein KC345_g1127 [Hortaea werneckii]|nr:hypothetical protein KC345_g1127 [Hortaea werneckii]